ncbi:hypothetical protein EAH76_16105 [Sphingomonas glacialis]|uniref:Uncharacterized protein n=2 Tax=Sphingomonas glacialis TaxID=658225 RepID=A0A502FSW4_9SPHN|nr:hypothetical protein EAH76_16105 [Sphingomonas glacialis]
MPSPEPNSVRAMRVAKEKDGEPVVSGPVQTPVRLPDISASRADTGIYRLMALREKLSAAEAQSKVLLDKKAGTNAPSADVETRIRELIEKSRGRPEQGDDPDRADTLSDRLRTRTEKIGEPMMISQGIVGHR